MEYRELSQSWMCINKGMVLKGVVWKSGCGLPFFFFFCLTRQAWLRLMISPQFWIWTYCNYYPTENGLIVLLKISNRRRRLVFIYGESFKVLWHMPPIICLHLNGDEDNPEKEGYKTLKNTGKNQRPAD